MTDNSKNTKNIIDGFEDDFNTIVEEFKNISPDLRFTEFLKFWSEKSLNLLFVNRFDPRELLEAISKFNQHIVDIITTKDNEAYFIVGLYFLICLYGKQPDRLKRKIRMTCEDAIHIQKKIFSYSTNPDIKFVWKHLRTMKSIDFVEKHKIYGPSMLTSRGVKNLTDAIPIEDNPLLKEQKDMIEFLEGKLEPTLLSFETLCAPYEQIKDVLRLNELTDANVDCGTGIELSDFLKQTKDLLSNMKGNGDQV